jgi:glycogen debranching enzyme
MAPSGLELSRQTHPGKFFDVVGRRAAVFGYENRGFEAWAYPVKLVDDVRLSFRVEGYPLEMEGVAIQSGITVRPEATTFTYSHAAFTVRQTLYAPVDEPGIVMLLDVDTVLPMTVIASFRPRLRLMWPAGLMTGDLGWDEKEQVYTIGEETKRFAAAIGSPGARDLSVMPYQEEPRDVPIRFEIPVPREAAATHFVPIVIAGSVKGRDDARATYRRLLADARALYEKNVTYYAELQKRTLQIDTPDDRLDDAYAWAKVGVDKGLATNPLLGTGLVAGFRTSGESERPGFAWMFGRDALWSALAVHSYGDFAAARTALEFLRGLQRKDGKIPHEISQSATLLPWFQDYEYPWASADATPLYVAVQADHWNATGNREFLAASWDSIVRAWRFTAATDTDGNGLVENTKVGHGWTEGSPPYPPHEEIYLQGAWIAACDGLAVMADAMGDAALAGEARAWSAKTRAAVEKTYWLPLRGFYAFATALAKPEKEYNAEPGPRRAQRQKRIEALRGKTIVDEDTVLPAVPLWWRILDAEKAQSEIDHLGAAEMAADWGHRLISSKSDLYDPLSYHYGSVWPLFTGWASLGSYRYSRPHVGYQALMSTALLTYQGALGYVTELLSGDFNAPFGRSSHHQVWSEAMVVSPLVRGLLGIEVDAGGKTLRIAPQLPATWDKVVARNVAAGSARYDVTILQTPGLMTIVVERQGAATAGPAVERLVLSPGVALDANAQAVMMNGESVAFRPVQKGDLLHLEMERPMPAERATIAFEYAEGTKVFAPATLPEPGARSEGLRLLRARPELGVLRIVAEGRAGRRYPLAVRTPRDLGEAPGVTVRKVSGGAELEIAFEGPEGTYVRRDVSIPLK